MKLSAFLTACLFGAFNICDAVNLPHWGVATLTKKRSKSHPTTQAFANNKSPLYQGAASKKRRVNVSPVTQSESKGDEGTATGGAPGVSNASTEPNHTPPSATATAVGGVPVSAPASEQAPSESPTGPNSNQEANSTPSIPTAPTADDGRAPTDSSQESQSTTVPNGSSDEVPTITDGTDGEGPSTMTDSTDSESHQQKENHEDGHNENDNQDESNDSNHNDFSPHNQAREPLVNTEEEEDEEELEEEEEGKNENNNAKAQVSEESTSDMSDEEQKCVDDLVDLAKALPLDSRNKMLEKIVVAVNACLTKE